MKLVYISGPYRAATMNGVRENIEHAYQMAVTMHQAGKGELFPVVPHLNTQFMDGVMPDNHWLTGDCLLLERCDAVLMIGEFEKSEGCAVEMQHAIAKGIPVYTNVKSLFEALTSDEVVRAAFGY
jgi:nucleoside 2-deoxyribosyltransferase